MSVGKGYFDEEMGLKDGVIKKLEEELRQMGRGNGRLEGRVVELERLL